MKEPKIMEIGSTMRFWVFGDLMEQAVHLSFWRYDPEMNLVSSTSKDMELLDNLFAISGCKQAVLKAAQSDAMPVAVADTLSLVWLAVPQYIEGALQHIFVLGPSFNSYISEETLMAGINKMQLSHTLQSPLIERMKQIPSLQHTTLMNYGIMLYYCVTGETIDIADIRMQLENEESSQSMQDYRLQSTAHSMYAFEQLYFSAVKNGTVNFKAPTYIEPLGLGTLVQGKPLRQVQDQMIVKITLSCRSALSAGLPEQEAYAVSDRYIQAIEDCNNVTSAYDCGEQCYREYISRVHKFKQRSGQSRELYRCLVYLEEHLTEPVSFDDMAEKLGYNRSYLCTKFKKEMNQTIGEYLQNRRIEYAKLSLTSSDRSIQDISQMLQFGSSSYFGAVFRKATGMSPIEYRNHGSSEPENKGGKHYEAKTPD